MLGCFDYLVVVVAAVVVAVVVVGAVAVVAEVVGPGGFAVVADASCFVFAPQVARHPYSRTCPCAAGFGGPENGKEA
jgi:hypothetical protein